MEINFKYLIELGLFVQLFLLGAILSVIVMYITEAVKKWLANVKFIADHTWVMSLICFLISIGFGVGWSKTFAAGSISTAYAIWLGVLLWLGSTGFYTSLENSDGFWGKTVKSLSNYINSAAQKEADQAKTAQEEAKKKADEELAAQQAAKEAAEKAEAERVAKEQEEAAARAEADRIAAEQAAAQRAAEEAAQSAQKIIGYAFKAGETFTEIAQRYGCDVNTLMAMNGYTYETARTVAIGTVISVPVSDEIYAQTIANQTHNTAPEPQGLKFRMPVNYIGISVPFSTSHLGVDFGYDTNYGGPNQPVYAATSGIVQAAENSGGAGNYVKIRFDDGVNSWYTYSKHLSRIDVAEGQTVTIGQQIGLMGDTGDADGCHLHFDLVKMPLGQYYNNANAAQRAQYSVNPLDYLVVDNGQIVGNVTAQKYQLKYI